MEPGRPGLCGALLRIQRHEVRGQKPGTHAGTTTRAEQLSQSVRWPKQPSPSCETSYVPASSTWKHVWWQLKVAATFCAA